MALSILSLFPKYELNTDFQQALIRALDMSKSTYRDFNWISYAVTPCESFSKLNAAAPPMYEAYDWHKVAANFRDINIYKNINSSVGTWQQNAISELSAKQQEWARTVIDNGKLFIATPQWHPQITAANLINTTLDTLVDMKARLMEQTQTALNIQSSFMSLYHKTLFAFLR